MHYYVVPSIAGAFHIVHRSSMIPVPSSAGLLVSIFVHALIGPSQAHVALRASLPPLSGHS